MSTAIQFPIEIEALTATGADARWGTGERVRPPYELTPRQYLTFAEEELQDSSLRSRLNALHNAKRAIGCSIDSVLWNFGLSRSIRQPFPTKIGLIRALSLLSPRIIEKVLRSRNLVEHRYASVSSGEAEDAVDVAMLFVTSLQPFSHYRYDEVELFLPNAVEGIFKWIYDGDCDESGFERKNRYGVERESPVALYFEFYRRVRGTPEEDGVYQGPKSQRRSATWLLEKRGVVELGHGFVRSTERELYLKCSSLFVRSAQNSWLWTESKE